MHMSTEQTLELLSRLVGNVFFPIFVAIYVLVRLEPAMIELTDTIHDLTIVVAQLNGVDIPFD